MKLPIALPLVAATVLLVACGESTTENVTQINQTGMDVVDSVSDLPKCTKDNEGDVAWVKGESSSRVCVDGKWFATKESARDTVVLAGDTVYMDGGDFSCTTKELKDKSGIKIICNGDSIGVVLNGAKGEQGEQGVAGKDGKDGAPGVDGKDGSAGEPGEAGSDGAGCTLAQTGTQLTITCGEKSATIDMGEGGGIAVDTMVLDSEKVAISLDEVTGASQKGPFLSGSKVLVKELEDGRSLTQTGNNFDGKILNDKGEFKITARMLVSQYVMLEANGYYRDEITGGISPSTLTLFGITDVTTRNVVNINLLTHLEYERVIYLVTKKKMTVTQAKRQAQQEVFGLLDINAEGFSNSEDLSIAGSSDEDGALLAFSVMFQGGRSVAQLTELLTRIATDMEKDGTWDDATTRMNIADWSADADSSGKLDTIRSNVAGWNLSVMVPNFEQYVRHFWTMEYGLDSCKKEGVVKAATAGKRKGTNTRYICKDVDGLGDMRWVIASDIEKDTYQWKVSTDGALKNGDVTGKAYVFDSTGSFNGTAGWREAESIEKQYGGCREALFDSIRTDVVYAYYYTCRKSTHTWVREVDYLLIDTQYWPDSTDGKVKWGDSVGVVDNLERICYVWDDAAQYRGWRTGNTSDCELGLLGCTAKRGGEMRKATSGRYYSCSENNWIEIGDDVYINTYLYRCTIDDEGDRVYKDGDLVYGIEKTTTRYACENEQWRTTGPGEEKAGKACTALLQGTIQGDSITCDMWNWRKTMIYDYPVGTKWLNTNLEYGTLEDERDGRVYKTIKIGNQVWMAENLAYADSVNSPYLRSVYQGNTWCYQDDSTNCLKGGRYYSWTAAMNIDVKWQSDSPSEVEGLIHEPHQGICPNGWHIPTSDEWTKMYESAGGVVNAIQATRQSIWPGATNSSGFSAILVGRISGGGFSQDNNGFWSAIERGKYDADFWLVSADYAGLNSISRDRGFPVRCVQDDPVTP